VPSESIGPILTDGLVVHGGLDIDARANFVSTVTAAIDVAAKRSAPVRLDCIIE
jgi:hypothetical protein